MQIQSYDTSFNISFLLSGRLDDKHSYEIEIIPQQEEIAHVKDQNKSATKIYSVKYKNLRGDLTLKKASKIFLQKVPQIEIDKQRLFKQLNLHFGKSSEKHPVQVHVLLSGKTKDQKYLIELNPTHVERSIAKIKNNEEMWMEHKLDLKNFKFLKRKQIRKILPHLNGQLQIEFSPSGLSLNLGKKLQKSELFLTQEEIEKDSLNSHFPVESQQRDHPWLEFLEKMLISRNPLQGQSLNPLAVYGPCKGNIFLKNMINEPNISIGDFTYAHMESLEAKVLQKLVPYSFGDKVLKIGKFCSIGFGTQFISPYANHQMHSFTTYPFWHVFSTQENIKPWHADAEAKGDTIIGSDVWFGRECMIMPGIRIGDGAVIAARSVVTSDVPSYAVIGGNPAKLIKYRFNKEMVQELLKVRWWNWELEKIIENHGILMEGNIDKLRLVSLIE